MPNDGFSVADVTDFYDEFTDLLQELLGGRAIHFGLSGSDLPEEDRGAAQDRLTLAVARRTGATAGSQVLDIGCGTGQPAVLAAQTTGAFVTGITISKNQLAAARAHGHERVRFEEANALALPFPDDHFDAAYMIESFVHMPDKARALAEAARCLRRRGTLIIADLLSPGQAGRPSLEETGLLVQTQPTLPRLKALLRAADLTLVAVEDIQDRVEPEIKATLALLAQDHPRHRARLGQNRYDKIVRMLRVGLTEVLSLRYVLVTARGTA
jgi:ubiquinone/menaquinone biosynthesis C-methylase UbiE